MRKEYFILFLSLFIFGCKDDQPDIPHEEVQLPPYIKTLIEPDTIPPYQGNYYIYVSFTNTATAERKEMTFDEHNSAMAIRYDCSTQATGLSEYTVLFIGSPQREQLEVSFFYDLATDTAFHVYYADYYYGDPWKAVAGANVLYYMPVNADIDSPRYIYQGTDTENSYFRITYHGKGRVNGTFLTTWKECCGEETTYKVMGAFSMPLFRYTNNPIKNTMRNWRTEGLED